MEGRFAAQVEILKSESTKDCFRGRRKWAASQQTSRSSISPDPDLGLYRRALYRADFTKPRFVLRSTASLKCRHLAIFVA